MTECHDAAFASVTSAYTLHLQYRLFSIVLPTGAHMNVPGGAAEEFVCAAVFTSGKAARYLAFVGSLMSASAAAGLQGEVRDTGPLQLHP